MSTPETSGPQDRERLKEEIARTRADLGDTVEQLAAKTDVKARGKEAVANVADRAKTQLADATEHAKEAAANVADKAKTHLADASDQAKDAAARAELAVADAVDTVRAKARDADLPGAVRRPIPLAAIGAAVVAVGVIIYVLRRRRA